MLVLVMLVPAADHEWSVKAIIERSKDPDNTPLHSQKQMSQNIQFRPALFTHCQSETSF
jgi:hypothetical protein